MKLRKLLSLSLIGGAMISFTGCSNDDFSLDDNNNNTGGESEGARKYFNVVVGINVEDNGSTYSAAYTDLSSPSTNISFSGWGYEVPSVRTARVYGSDAGDFLYNLNYGGGTISKYRVNGGQNYSEMKTLDISIAMGTTNPRWTKMNNQFASLHHVTTTHIFEDEAKTAYDYTKTNGFLTAVDLETFSIITEHNPTGGYAFEFPRSAQDIEMGLHVWRIDAPVICGDKVYYGLNKRIYDANTDTNITTSDYSASSLVVDFPSLQNARIITSSVGQGSTQGYRTPIAHTDEKKDIYQMTAAPTKILKISNGDYVNSYDFDLSDALKMNVGSNGWFYVGDGIGYIPFFDADKGSGSDVAAWGVARIDLYNKTAVKLNLPANLWLFQYQNGIVEDGKFYMAIAPLGGDGNIYIFDTQSSSADGFVKGASIQTIDNSSAYLGVF